MKAACILVVDDNAVNMKLAADLLGFEGYTILKARDAQEALSIIALTIPDLILMDIGLPDMDGLTLTKKLKAEGKIRDIPIVAVTASAMKGDDEKAFAAGCDGYITKPIDTRKFPDQIASFLNQSNPPTV